MERNPWNFSCFRLYNRANLTDDGGGAEDDVGSAAAHRKRIEPRFCVRRLRRRRRYCHCIRRFYFSRRMRTSQGGPWGGGKLRVDNFAVPVQTLYYLIKRTVSMKFRASFHCCNPDHPVDGGKGRSNRKTNLQCTLSSR